jgi:hypothetical protein
VVGETLVIAADQGGVHCWFHAVWPVGGEQDAEQAAAQRVYLGVPLGQPVTGERIAVLDRGRGGLGEVAGEQAHPGKHRSDLSRDHLIRVFEPGDLGDVPGEAALRHR